jgi:hypothetical protein
VAGGDVFFKSQSVDFFQNDDLSRKLNDFERVNKVQRTMNDQNSALEQDVKALKMK